MENVDINKCQITHYPENVLAKSAKPVEKINDNIKKLVEKMTDIMIENRGCGLAAPQAGVSLRLFIISVDGNRENLKVYINPTVTGIGEFESFEEGCLSIPGVYTKIRRFKKAKVTALNLDSVEFTEEADGLLARALQHENDHINGITIADKMGSAARIAHRRQIKKLVKKYEKAAKNNQ